MNWPPQQPQQVQQPFPGAQQPYAPNPGMAGPASMPPGQVAAAAQHNTFAQMLSAPPRERRNREKPSNGTHVVQFTRESKMDSSQGTMQPYLLVSYVVIQSTVPQMVNKTFAIPMMLNNRGSIQALAEMTKAILGMNVAQQMAAQNVTPYQMAQYILQSLINPQSGQGLFALLNTWRSNKGKNGGPPPSYEEAFVNHDWLMAHQQPFTLDQAAAAGHKITAGSPPPPVMPAGMQGGWGAPPAAPAQQAWQPQPQAPAPQAQPQTWQPQPAPQQPWQPQQQAPQAFPPPANVVPQQQQPPAPPAVHFPQPTQQPQQAAFPSAPPGFPTPGR